MRILFSFLLLSLCSLSASAKIFEIGPYSSDQLRVRVVVDQMLNRDCNTTKLNITYVENRSSYYNPLYKMYVRQSRANYYCPYKYDYLIKAESEDYLLRVTPGVVLKVDVPDYIDRVEIDPIL